LQRLKEATEKIKNRKDTLLRPPPGTAATAGPKLKGRIELKKGDSFSFERSPDVVGKDLIISATITSETADGVIVAQGGTLVGYSLFLREGKVIFGVRVESKLKELACSEVVTGKSAKVEAKLGKDGTRSLTVNGKTLTTTGPALKPQPKMGLSAGEDQSHNVGNYRIEQFKGSIENLVLEIR
jgi:arylsulfatase